MFLYNLLIMFFFHNPFVITEYNKQCKVLRVIYTTRAKLCKTLLRSITEQLPNTYDGSALFGKLFYHLQTD